MTDHCPAWFDGDKPSDRTHTCNLDPGHTGLHECPRCGGTWGDIERAAGAKAVATMSDPADIRRVLDAVNKQATRVVVRCSDGTAHTTYYDLSPTRTSLGHLLLERVNSDKGLCGPHVVEIDTVPRAEVVDDA